MFHDVGHNTVFDDLLCHRTQERPALSVCHWGTKVAKSSKQKRECCLQAFRCWWCCRGEWWEAVRPCGSLSFLSTSAGVSALQAQQCLLVSSAAPAGVGSAARSARVPLEILCCSSSEMVHSLISLRCDSAGQYQPPTVSCRCLWLH